MMKESVNRILTISLMTIVLAAAISCEKTPKSNNGAIGFKVVSNKTKGTVVTTDNIAAQHASFYVDLIESNGTVVLNDVDNAPVLGELVTYTASETDTKGVWQMAHMTYWKDRTLNAWAYSPATLNGGKLGVVTASDSDGSVSYETEDEEGNIVISKNRDKMTFNFLVAEDGAKEDDLLFAYTQGCTKKTKGQGGKEGQIPIHFYHALSAIQFELGAVSESDATTYEFGNDVRIDAIRINNIRRAGTCDFTVANTLSESKFNQIFTWDTADNDDYDRSFGSVSQSYSTIVDGSKKNFNTEATDNEVVNEGVFFLIPQTMNTASGFETSLTISWSKKNSSNAWETMPERTQVITTLGGKTVTWIAGYRYLYTIRIGVKAADTRVDLTVLPWDKASMELDYDEGPAVAEGGKLSLIPLASSGSTIAVADGADGVTGRFTLGEPVGAEWLVSVSDPEHFDVRGLNGSSNPATGIVDGNTAMFYIKKKEGIARTQKFTTKVHITLMMPDGSFINLDGADMLDTQKWDVILNPLN